MWAGFSVAGHCLCLDDRLTRVVRAAAGQR